MVALSRASASAAVGDGGAGAAAARRYVFRHDGGRWAALFDPNPKRGTTVTCATSRLEAMPTLSEQRCIDLMREKKVANGMGFAC